MLKKGLEKNMFFYWCSYTLCIQTIMNTNKVNVSARLLFITRDLELLQLLNRHVTQKSRIQSIYSDLQSSE